MTVLVPVNNEQGVPVELAAALAKIAALEAQNEALKKARNGKLTLKVSEKGALSVYGMGRFPVTLYRQQWERLLGNGDQIKAFIEANASVLTVKE